MTSAVAVVVGVVEIVGSMGMAQSSIAVLDVSLRGSIEVALEHRWCIVAGTGGAGVVAGVDDAGDVVSVAGIAGGVAGAMLGEADVVVAR